MSGLRAGADRPSSLEEALGHRFGDPALLRQALTHSSAARPRAGHPSYERLEFLGDRVLGLAIAGLLLERFPREDEGGLSRRLAALVRREMLAVIGRDLGVGPLMLLAPTEDASLRDSDSVLADITEAVLGALYLDAGFVPARAVIERLWSAPMSGAIRPPTDPKTELQVWTQARGLGLPAYEVVGTEGPAHQPSFTVRATLSTGETATETGTSKRQAETAAAASLLTILKAGRR